MGVGMEKALARLLGIPVTWITVILQVEAGRRLQASGSASVRAAFTIASPSGGIPSRVDSVIDNAQTNASVWNTILSEEIRGATQQSYSMQMVSVVPVDASTITTTMAFTTAPRPEVIGTSTRTLSTTQATSASIETADSELPLELIL